MWHTGWTCVDDGQEYELDINGGHTISSDVDILRMDIRWYDDRLEPGGVDDIDLRLRDLSSGQTLSSSTDDWDNKQRIAYGGAGGEAVSMVVTGEDVTADNAGCGTNSMKVFFAVRLEDDDGDGPGYTSDCIGAEQR